MNNKKLWSMIALAFLLVLLSFIVNFRDQNISNELQDWSHFGSYVGGTLGPLLSFLSVVLLIKTLELQKKSSESMEDEIERGKQQDKIRSFESHFFNMIESQKKNFETFTLSFDGHTISSVSAVNSLEDLIYEVKKKGGSAKHIRSVIEAVDPYGNLFNATRIFYVICKIIDEHLSDQKKFDEQTRLQYYQTLVYFTDYALLRLICISTVFNSNTKIASYILSNTNLKVISKRSGLAGYISKLMN